MLGIPRYACIRDDIAAEFSTLSEPIAHRDLLLATKLQRPSSLHRLVSGTAPLGGG